jgi:hypothetical protein
MRRIIVLAVSAILALSVAVPIAAGQTETTSNSKNQAHSNDLKKLAAEWWNWAVATNPSPLEGSYTDGPQCDGEFVDGVFFLAGTTGGDATRTCTVPADTPLFFPVLNVVCSEAPTAPEPDPTPYTKCAKDIVKGALTGSDPYATLDGKKLTIRRIASKPFTWEFPQVSDVFPTVPAGSYDAATYGLWVYVAKGLPEGEHTVQFGGDFPAVPFSVNVTYELTAT